MPDEQNANENDDERNEADMNWDSFAKVMNGWTRNANYLQKELGNGMQYRIWNMHGNTVIIGYGTWDPQYINGVRNQFQQNKDMFILGDSPGHYIVLKYRDNHNNRNFGYEQVPAALQDFKTLLGNAGVLPGEGAAPAEAREVRLPRPPESPAQVPLLNDGFWNDPDNNPWLDKKSLQNTKSLFLENDRQFIEQYQPGEDKYKLHGEAYPQPYIGFPTAPIWLLMKNPGYSPVDEAEITGIIPEDLRKRFNFQENPQQERCRLLRDQLSFKQESPFYPLEEDFHIWHYNGVSPQGSYRWWQQKLLGTSPNAAPVCKEARERLQYFFDLEFFPYHSRSFDPKIALRKGLARQIAHHSFWKAMVKYALEKNKILILRGFMLREVKQVAGEELFREKMGNIFRLASGNASISIGNLKLVRDSTPLTGEAEKAFIARRLAEAMRPTMNNP